jgi:hypothetical protein
MKPIQISTFHTTEHYTQRHYPIPMSKQGR